MGDHPEAQIVVWLWRWGRLLSLNILSYNVQSFRQGFGLAKVCGTLPKASGHTKLELSSLEPEHLRFYWAKLVLVGCSGPPPC